MFILVGVRYPYRVPLFLFPPLPWLPQTPTASVIRVTVILAHVQQSVDPRVVTATPAPAQRNPSVVALAAPAILAHVTLATANLRGRFSPPFVNSYEALRTSKGLVPLSVLHRRRMSSVSTKTGIYCITVWHLSGSQQLPVSKDLVPSHIPIRVHVVI